MCPWSLLLEMLFDALNIWLEQRCQTLWQEIRHPQYKDRTIADVWQDEVICLMSIPASFANRPISLHVYAHRLVMVAEEKVIAEYQRVFTRDHSQMNTKWKKPLPPH